MIVIDTSAIVAIFLGEPDADRCAATIAAAEATLLPAPAWLECSMVLGGKGGASGLEKLDALIHSQGIEVVPFTAAHARAAREAFISFGKGRHRAGLNFGDCLSYGVATTEGLPLLYVGTDFGLTDVEAAGV